MADHLHIVLHDVPYPPDYGGVVDPFYMIKALHEEGIKLHLHCFEYGRKKQPELEPYAEEVHYYHRSEGHKGFSLSIPYIVSSRNDPALWKRLREDDHPILLQGIHSTFGLHEGLLKDRKVCVRLFNVEADYYTHLAKWERSLPKKAFFHHEKRLLERYEKSIANKATFLTLTEQDAKAYQKRYGAKDVHHIPPFLHGTTVNSETGSGNYVLYHGNLSIAENEKAATWLLEKIFPELDIPFVIAGKDPSSKLVELAHKMSHTCIVENPSPKEMHDLIRKAQAHVLPSFTNTGIKLKLLHALLNGRHVIANTLMTTGTQLEKACLVEDTAAMMKYAIFRLYHTPFTEKDIQDRQTVIDRVFSRNAQMEKLLRLLY